MLTLKEIVHKTGLPKSTIRYYQERGLIPEPERKGFGRNKGMRGYFPKDTVSTIKRIEKLKSEGKPLREVKQILEVSNVEMRVIYQGGKLKKFKIDPPPNTSRFLKKVKKLRKEGKSWLEIAFIAEKMGIEIKQDKSTGLIMVAPQGRIPKTSKEIAEEEMIYKLTMKALSGNLTTNEKKMLGKVKNEILERMNIEVTPVWDKKEEKLKLKVIVPGLKNLILQPA